MFLLCFVFVLLHLLWFYGLLFLCSLFADDAFLALSPDIMSARNHCGRHGPLVSYLQQLYWLPISETPCMSYIAITGSAPSYLSELLHLYSSSGSLRSSSDRRILKLQRFSRKTRGFRTFSLFGPHIWNNLRREIRHSASLSSSNSKLKTFLSQNISAKQHCPSPLSVCTVC